MKPVIIKNKIYRYAYYLYIVTNEKQAEQLNEIIKTQHSITFDSNLMNANGWCIATESRYSIIIINAYKTKTYLNTISTLRHEVHHASANTWYSIAAKFNELDEEPFLYLNDWLFKKCYNIVSDVKYKIKIKNTKKML